MLSSLTKAGTPLQSVNSPFVVPSPSTPLALFPLLRDPEKQISSVSSLSNVGNLGQTQAMSSLGQPQSLAIGTPGIYASPLLAEFTSLDGTTSAMVSGKSAATELPIDFLLKAVKSMSTTLGTAVSDIQSFISLSDRIAGSTPGNGSRAAIGEDLVAVTKSRMQLKNVSTHNGNSATKKMRRDTSAMPLNAASSAGSVDGLEALDSELTVTSMMERPKIEDYPCITWEICYYNFLILDISTCGCVENKLKAEEVVECYTSLYFIISRLKSSEPGHVFPEEHLTQDIGLCSWKACHSKWSNGAVGNCDDDTVVKLGGKSLLLFDFMPVVIMVGIFKEGGGREHLHAVYPLELMSVVVVEGCGGH
ncbi:hypothetical protein GIB67_034345 [Kingdonia uniflora]|uniref:Uncharacterized protein n=1 Tax=Kingdonia uniflora TaxID=39325 RepID=A0A7J7NS83_9MAGN|nr:hypothetical protein GIB67_034345 [Kingdonia uniflora]